MKTFTCSLHAIWYSFFDNEMDFAITQIRFYLDAFNNYNLKTTYRSRLCVLQKFKNLEYNLDVISSNFFKCDSRAAELSEGVMRWCVMWAVCEQAVQPSVCLCVPAPRHAVCCWKEYRHPRQPLLDRFITFQATQSYKYHELLFILTVVFPKYQVRIRLVIG